MKQTAIRGATLSFIKDPFLCAPEEAYEYWPDALIIMKDGLIDSIGPYSPQAAQGLAVENFPDSLIVPGFIDTHLHYPQIEMIGAYGEQLLEWLNTYTFPTEKSFADKDKARRTAAFFLKTLLRNGVTSAAVYCTVHPESVDAFFEESSKLNTRMIAGKVLMDRNAPEDLRDTAESGYQNSKRLIERWHQKGRQLYAVTPRWAVSSTPAQLEAAAKLWQETPGCYMQTHLAENTGELALVKELFPKNRSYFDVYDEFGLTGPRSIFGHCIHIDETDFSLFHERGSAMAHCPTSNLFLGSGLFKMFEAKKKGRPVRVGLASDVGAGTTLSALKTLSEAYKVAQMNQTRLNSIQGFYLATAGGAEALYLEDRLGAIKTGYEADLAVLNLKATPFMDFRMSYARTLEEKLFVLMTIGDDRAVQATYVAGTKVYDAAEEKG